MTSSHARSGRSARLRTPTFSSSRNRRTRAAAPIDLGSSTATQFIAFSPHVSSRSAASSTTSTNATSTSRFSLSTSFVNLTTPDIDFFDQVIDNLPPGADDFATLKRSYNQVRGVSGYNVNEEEDAFLWDTLLKLIQVRGKNWAGRWDAVRMAIGLEPRISSGSEREQSGLDHDEEEEEDTSESDTVRDRQDRRSSNLATPVARPNTTREEIETLRKRMALLTAEAGSLVGTIQKRTEQENHHNAPRAPALALRGVKAAMSEDRRAPTRHLRFAEQVNPNPKRSHKATIVESASDEESTRSRAIPQRSKVDVKSKDETSSAQRQFDEVVARSRIEREAQRRAEEEQREAAQEARLIPLLKKAEQLSSIHLKDKCFIWWKTSCNQRWNREQEVKRARDEVVLRKVMAAWQYRLTRNSEVLRGAEKVDIVRCKLRAWRVWRRMAHERRLVRKEEKRTQLKGAYTLIRKKLEERVVREKFLQWRLALMEHRTAHFRTQHLVRGAFSVWRLHLWRAKTLKDKEDEVMSKITTKLLSQSWEQWVEASQSRSRSRLAEAFQGHRLMQSAFTKWTTERDEKAKMRQKEALADRWRARRTKRVALRLWQAGLDKVRDMEQLADDMRLRQLVQMKIKVMKIWTIREREQLFNRIGSSRLKDRAMAKWTGKHRLLSSRLGKLEERVSDILRANTLERSFRVWRETTSQIVTSQNLASERDRRKVKLIKFAVWREALENRRAEMKRAKTIDQFLLQRRTWAVWTRRHLEAKGQKLDQRRNHKLLSVTLAFWKARSAEKKHENLAVGLMQSRVENRIRQECLWKWTAAVIERKSVLMEAGEKRDGLILQQAWLKWINACLRHEDMLNLSKSFIDVKKEDLLRRSLSRWINFARAERNRRERVEKLLQDKRRLLMGKVLEQWYDRYVEATLRPIEYEALVQRQRNAQEVVFTRWKSRTKSLPAIRFDHVRVKSHAFYRWSEKLPIVKVENQAIRFDRQLMQRKGFRHWYSATKAKRAIRAAARFGGPSAMRLRATAHLHQRGNGNPFGGMGGSSSPSPVLRARNVDAPKTVGSVRAVALAGPPSTSKRKVEMSTAQGSLRESDLLTGSSEQQQRPLELDHHSDVKFESSNMPPALQRWMQSLGQGRKEVTLEDLEASSEPPSSILDQRWNQRRERIIQTPSPPASQVQSEATMRVKSSPRKLSNARTPKVEQFTTQNTMDLLRSRRKERRRSMIFDEG